MELLFVFVMKMLDTSLAAMKTMFTIKGLPLLAALASSISYLLYTVAMKQVFNDTGFLSTVVVALAVFLGQFITQSTMRKKDKNKEKLWKVSVTARTWNESFDFMEELEETGIGYSSEKKYNKRRQKVLGFDIFCETKEETAVVKKLCSKYGFKRVHAIEIKALKIDIEDNTGRPE